MIELKNVSKFYNDNNVVTVGLRNVSLTLNKGEFVAITGDSGSGKSTLLNVISSIDIYDEGEILFYGNETFYFNQNDSDIFRKNNVSFIFQKYNIVDSYTVLQNVMLPLLIKGKTAEDAKKEALEIIKRVGLEHRANNKGTKLSGGEKQRCVIARALATDSPILACDEPTGNLDSKTSDEIIKLIKEVSKEKLVLIVTHDYERIKDVCTRKIKLSDGEIVEDITFKEGEEEAQKEMRLVDVKPTKKTLGKLALRNILSTPKKTVFSTMVFTFVACLLLLLSLLIVRASYEANYTYGDTYGIVAQERMIIYSHDQQSLDMTKLTPKLEKYEYYENAFYEEISSSFRVENNFFIYAKFTYHKLNYDLVAGSSEMGENDFILVMPDYAYYDRYDEIVGKTIEMDSVADYDYLLPIGTLVGIGICEEINQSYLIGNNTNAKIANVIINNVASLTFESEQSDDNTFKKIYVKNEGKSYFAVPTALKDDIKFTFNLQGLYDISYDLDVVYTDEVQSPVFVVNEEFMNGNVAPIFGGVREIAVYTENVRNLTKNIEKLGYNVSVPCMADDNNSNGISLIVLYMLSGIIIVALVILFYISFSILQRIYLTKTKDYSIFRTLGLISKDLKKILTIEVVALTLFSVVLGGGLANLIIILTKIDLYKYFSGLLLLLYAGAMFVFGIATALRLNNKIFQNSVYQALKEGGE